MKVPAGGVDFRWSFCPQQAALPSARTPQVYLLPAEISVKVPAGGVVSS